MLGKKDKGLGTETAPSISRFVQAQKSVNKWKNITLDVVGDADRLGCEFFMLSSRAAQGKSTGDEWKLGRRSRAAAAGLCQIGHLLTEI